MSSGNPDLLRSKSSRPGHDDRGRGTAILTIIYSGRFLMRLRSCRLLLGMLSGILESEGAGIPKFTRPLAFPGANPGTRHSKARIQRSHVLYKMHHKIASAKSSSTIHNPNFHSHRIPCRCEVRQQNHQYMPPVFETV